MSSLNVNLIGRKIKSFPYEVSKEKIKEFAMALGEESPIYYDINKAKEAGFENIPAPLTFATCINFWGSETFFDDIAKIGVDVTRLLHLKENYSYINTIYAGAEVSVNVTVKDVKVGKMEMMTLEAIICDAKTNTELVIANMTIVMRPEGM